MITKLREGGAAIGGSRIPKDRVQPTIDAYVEQVLSAIPYDRYEPVGSTGKKASNGDIDLAVETSLTLEEISTALTSLGIEHIVAKGLGELNTKFPQYDANGPTEEFVQVDLMVGPPGAIDWLTFVYYAPFENETRYKPLNRTGTLYALLRCATEEIREDGMTYFYSMAPNRGVFQKAGKYVINKKGVEEFKSDRVEEGYHQDPMFFCEVISMTSSEHWSPDELKDTCEHIWAKIKQRYSPEIRANIDTYIRGFSENQKVPIDGPIILDEAVHHIVEAKTSHLTHIEDLLYGEGTMGGVKIFTYLESLFDELKGNTPKARLRTTVKIDGSPAVCLASSYPGVPGPFVGTKMTFSPRAPQIYQTPEEIDAKYGEIPDLANKLKAALAIVPRLGIPAGEVWKGDFLFTEEDLEVHNIDGTDYITFQPNTIVYAAPVDSEIGHKIMDSRVGIALHTRYTGNDLRTAEATASFDVNASQLHQLPDAFIIDANIPSIAGSVTLTAEETSAISNILSSAKGMFNSIRDFIEEISLNSTYVDILNTYENQAIRTSPGETQFTEDYVDNLITWVYEKYTADAETKKTDRGRAGVLERRDAIVNFFGIENRENFIALFELQRSVVHVKNFLIKKLNNLSKLVPFDREEDGTLKITNNEGFAVSDIDGNIIKLVDRLGFSRRNFARRAPSKITEDTAALIKNQSQAQMTPETLEAILATEGLTVKQKVSSRYWKVLVDGDQNARVIALKNFLKKYPDATVSNRRDVNFRGYKLEFKYNVQNRGQEFEDTLVLEAQQEIKNHETKNLGVLNTILTQMLPVLFDKSFADVQAIEGTGALNTRRPIRSDLLYGSPPILVALPSGAQPGNWRSIGYALADARVHLDDGTIINVSAKSGPNVAFINAGIGGASKWEETSRGILTAIGFDTNETNRIIEGFKIAAVKRRDAIERVTAELREKREIQDVRYDVQLDLAAVARFIANSVGGEYLMIHDNHGYWVDNKVRNLFTKDIEVVRVQYPGYVRSQLDIYLQSAGLSQIKVQIRAEKGSAIYPTRLQCLYQEDFSAISGITQVYEA
jgi:hypothetical protein